MTETLDRYAVDTWNGLPVYVNDRLALNFVSRHLDYVEVSFPTWLQIKDNREMYRIAVHLSGEIGLHSIPKFRDIPNHRVGAIFRESQTLLNEYVNGIFKRSTTPLREEIDALRGLLEEAENALNLAEQLGPRGTGLRK